VQFDIPADCRHLFSLELIGNINDQNVERICSAFCNLTSLVIKSTKITDKTANLIAQHLTKLNALNLLTPHITSSGFSTICNYLENLEYLSLRLLRLDESGLSSVLTYCNRLKSLELEAGNCITAQQLQSFKQKGIELQLHSHCEPVPRLDVLYRGMRQEVLDIMANTPVDLFDELQWELIGGY